VKGSLPRVMRPIPPSCINSIRTPCPNVVNAVPVSTTIKPVTVTAEVAVKNASDQVMSSVEAIGNIRSNAPTVIQLKYSSANKAGVGKSKNLRTADYIESENLRS